MKRTFSAGLKATFRHFSSLFEVLGPKSRTRTVLFAMAKSTVCMLLTTYDIPYMKQKTF